MGKRKRALSAPSEIDLEDAAAAQLLAEHNASQPAAAARAEFSYEEVPIGMVHPSPLNPRKFFETEALAELADSLVAKGILQPLLARPMPDGNREIIIGERRWRAAMLAVADGRLPADMRIPLRTRQCSDTELVILAANENMARQDMTPLEQAECFEAVRPHVVRLPGEDDLAAIGRTLGTSRQTVFRRLKLLRLAPALRDALAAGEINLQQADAFTIGSPEKQVAHLTELRAANLLDDPDEGDPEAIRWELSGTRIATAAAIFEKQLYTGEIVTDDGTGATFFDDTAQFHALQAAAIDALSEELRKSWPWVDVEIGGKFHALYANTALAPHAGAVIVVNPQTHRVEIVSPVERLAEAAQRRTVAAAAEAGLVGPAAKEARTLTDAQAIAVKRAKTRALRKSVVAMSEVSLALAIIGLLGTEEIAIRDGRSMLGPDNRVAASAAERRLEHTLLAPIAAALRRDGVTGDEWRQDDLIGSARAALILRALLDCAVPQLLAIHAFLVAERIGSWFDPFKTRIGDSPLAIALAEITGAAAELPDLWYPDEGYFKAMSRERLTALVDRHGFDGARNAKKAELVAWCCAQKDEFWTPDKFPETQFLDEAAMKAALAGGDTALGDAP